VSLSRIVLAVVALAVAAAAAFLLFQAWDQRAAPPIVISDAAATRPVVVDLRGAVTAPGVYELPPGARVQDALDAGGGLTDAADLSTINLARRLRDGEVVIVAALPEVGSTAPAAPADPLDDVGAGTARVNLNSASAVELDALPGIGAVLAGRIVDFREEHGPYRAVDDLIHVEGISARTIEDLRDLVTTAP
jgi:competence protein ComEA